MLLVIIPNFNILLESANYYLHTLKNAEDRVLAPPYYYNQLIETEKYEVQIPSLFTPQSSINHRKGNEQTNTPMIAPTEYFWILHMIEILILLQATILLG